MARQKENKLEEVKPQALAVQPEYDVRGKEDPLDDKDRIYPMLSLVQKMSPQEHLDVAKPGEFINSLTLENHGKAVTLIPILVRRQRIMWIPRKAGGGIECRSFDGKQGTKWGECAQCRFSKWPTVEEQPDPKFRKPGCTEYWTFPSLILREQQEPDLCVVSLGMTKYSTGKKLANLIHFKPVAAFAAKYLLKSVTETGVEGDYENVEVNGSGLLTREDPLYQMAEHWYGLLHKDAIKTEENTL